MYRCGGSNNAMVFSMPYDGESPVDCTLSLGTPATRLTGDYDRVNHERRSTANWSSNFCWDILQPSPSQKAVHGGGNGGTAVAEPLLARRCANCDTTSTPLWRNGPRGPKVGFPVIRFYIFFTTFNSDFPLLPHPYIHFPLSLSIYIYISSRCVNINSF
ncbi:putative transcription factor C2C2-GATA family [Helianthus annuus]|nr:putative transcription factor C2C2-GATA family [Helianthus annuus]